MKQYSMINPETIRILAVAPYEGLQELLEREVRAFPEMQMDVVVGDLEEGVRLAKDHFHGNYDIIISRGGTAQLVREQVDLPVTEISTSITDILQAIQLSEGFFGKRAVIGFSNITDRAKDLKILLDFELEVFTLKDPSDIGPILDQLKKDNYQTVISDVFSSVAAREAGFDAILITSGSASVRRALAEVRQQIRTIRTLREENLFLRQILSNHSGETIVFDKDGTLFYTSLDDYDPELIEIMRENLDDVLSGDLKRLTRSLNGYLYSIKASLSEFGDKTYIAYYYTRNRANGVSRNAGITNFTYREVSNILDQSFYRLPGEMNSLMPVIRDAAQSSRPVLILGEYGTGRSEVAKEIYMQCPRNGQSFIEIDCQTLTKRSADFLLNNQRSPLFFTGEVIHLMNLGFLSENNLLQLFTTMIHIDLCKNNFVIISGNPSHETLCKRIRYIKDKFMCLEIELLPLRMNIERIPVIANLYLSQLHASGKTNVIRFDNEAIKALTAYPWPGNYTQFERIINQLCVLSKDHMIHAEEINEILSMENDTPQRSSVSANYINLNRPLEQIEKEIVMTVVRENNGNQSAAAKQLGISRTTLWRIYKDTF